MSDFDVVIVGGGIAGASLGSQIAHRRRTLIIEAEQYCGYHSTGRSAAFWLESYGGPTVALLTAASHDFLDDPPAGFVDRSLLHRRGALHVSRDGWPELPGAVEHRRVERSELERIIPGLRPAVAIRRVRAGVRRYRRGRAARRLPAPVQAAGRGNIDKRRGWPARDSPTAGGPSSLANGSTLTASVLVDAAGAWADPVAEACGVRPLGIEPKRRTMVQLRIGRSGLRDLPLVNDSAGTFYFKGEGDRSVWLSPHDEIETDPCDAAPEEIDIATAIDRFEGVVDWPVERVERSWAGLRTFAPDRLPVYGFDPDVPRFLLGRRPGRVRHPERAGGGQRWRRRSCWARRPTRWSPTSTRRSIPRHGSANQSR